MSLVRKDKAERLVNLTMALLETRRPLSKDEIFTNVAGYSGTPEAMERMFERDKDDLRELNIEILVEAKDKYFDDEVGYRIAKSLLKCQKQILILQKSIGYQWLQISGEGRL